MLRCQGSTLLSGINGGSFVQLCPTACISPHQFHCQVATPEHKEKLSELMDHLQEYYEAMSDQEHCMANPAVGMNCVALFAGLLHVNSICAKVGRFPPCLGRFFLLHGQGRKKI